MHEMTGLIGIVVFVFLGWVLSENRSKFPFRVVLTGITLQFALAWLLLRFDPIVRGFTLFGKGVNAVIASADSGSSFVFGSLADPSAPAGFVFATRVLPVIVFFASFMAVLYHLGIMQRVIAAMAWVLRTTMGVTGSEAMAMAANIFVGQTEAPLCVKPFIPHMTRAQLTTLMVGGFATIAGSVMAAYVGLLGGQDPASPQRVLFVKHLITASVLSAPAAFVMARIIVPETQQPVDEGIHIANEHKTTRNVLDAAAAGATDGLRLALNVAAMLIAFVSLIAVINLILGAVGNIGFIHSGLLVLGIKDPSLEVFLGWLLAPIAWTMGVPWNECAFFGTLLGEKLVVTEFVAYVNLAGDIHASEPVLSERTSEIATYALCGFANFPSIAIQIGGLTALAPKRRSEFASLGLRAMFAGAFASWMTACIASVFL